jgi:hypothetical protein
MIPAKAFTMHTVSIKITDIAAPSPGLEIMSPVYAAEIFSESSGKLFISKAYAVAYAHTAFAKRITTVPHTDGSITGNPTFRQKKVSEAPSITLLSSISELTASNAGISSNAASGI